MNNTRSVFLYELRRNASRRGFLFATFGLPVLAILIFFGVQLLTQSGGEDTPTLQDTLFDFDPESIQAAGYVDYSGVFLNPGELAEGFIRPYPDESSAQAALEAGEIDVYYVIPADYLETGSVTSVLPRFNISRLNNAPLQQLFYSQFITLENIQDPLLQRLVVPAFIESFNLEDTREEVRDAGQDMTVVQTFAILFFLAIFGTNGYLMQSVIEEKQTRLVEVLLSSLRPMQLLVGKILAMGVLGLLQLVVYLAAFLIASSISTGNNPLEGVNITPALFAAAFVYFVLGYLLFAAAFGAVGAISTSLSEGPSISVIFVLPAMMPWILAFVFVDDPNGTMATVMSLLPITSPMGMMMRMTVTDVPLPEILLSVALLVAAIVVMMWFAGRLFRVNVLLSGKVPTLRQLPQLIRG